MILSLIVPVYNVEKYIRSCLDSIISAVDALTDEGLNGDCNNGDNIHPAEVILIDDGSPDCSGEICDEYADKYSYIKVIHQRNAGVAAARNVGIEIAMGDYIWFVDSDDEVTENSIADILDAISANCLSDVLMFDGYQFDGNDKARQNRPWNHFAVDRIFEDRKEVLSLMKSILYYPILSELDGNTNIPLAAPWDKVYRSAIIRDNIIRFNSELKVLDDMVFNMEVMGVAKHIQYVKSPIYYYRYVAESITRSYRPNRVDEDRQVWAYIRKYIEDYNWESNCERDEMKQALSCRIIKSYGISLNKQIFNKNSQMSIADKKKKALEVLEYDEYKEAFENVDKDRLEWKLRILLAVARLRSGMCLQMLAKLQSIL